MKKISKAEALLAILADERRSTKAVRPLTQLELVQLMKMMTILELTPEEKETVLKWCDS